ncbi:P-selectin glycoprotein ligand 1 [Latimeria chalumnae]|uniref:P-selectin glycoprotein ligand 1 n=1 Tax=Latimeria chalumnae TaxID=7897 RepID=UPI0003C15B13|nr:PREDICTED: P-selectin glycoprotein ligand 1 [Latimeria chalumnae]|eukprot:XP_006006199.1 PREDICTED: P-selectin glycoprotein ligand 1 [Latimeria chalumnae]
MPFSLAILTLGFAILTRAYVLPQADYPDKDDVKQDGPSVEHLPVSKSLTPKENQWIWTSNEEPKVKLHYETRKLSRIKRHHGQSTNNNNITEVPTSDPLMQSNAHKQDVGSIDVSTKMYEHTATETSMYTSVQGTENNNLNKTSTIASTNEASTILETQTQDSTEEIATTLTNTNKITPTKDMFTDSFSDSSTYHSHENSLTESSSALISPSQSLGTFSTENEVTTETDLVTNRTTEHQRNGSAVDVVKSMTASSKITDSTALNAEATSWPSPPLTSSLAEEMTSFGLVPGHGGKLKLTSTTGRVICHTTAVPVTTNKVIPIHSSTKDSIKKSCTVGRCLLAIAVLAGIATIFIICTIVLATKLSNQRQNYRENYHNSTELVCISAFMPEQESNSRSRIKPKLMKTFATNGDDSDGDDLTLHSFLPDHS